MKRLIIIIIVCVGLAATALADEILIKTNTHNSALVRWSAEDFANARPLPRPMVKSIDGATREAPPSLPVKETFGSEAAEPTVTGEERYALSRTLVDYQPGTISDLEEGPDPQASGIPEVPQKNRGTLDLDYTSSRLIPSSAAETFPYSAVGKLFLRDSLGNEYECSGAVIARRLVITAGNCVHGGRWEGWYEDFVFVPAYSYGDAPFGAWEYSVAFVNTQWADSDGEPPNPADWALLVMQDQDGYRISEITGKLGFVTDRMAPNHLHLLGYPLNFDSGQEMHQVTTGGYLYEGDNCYLYGSDMFMTGGPWVQNFNRKSAGQGGGSNKARAAVVGVTSFTAMSFRVQGASVLNRDFKVLRRAACLDEPGNC